MLGRTKYTARRSLGDIDTTGAAAAADKLEVSGRLFPGANQGPEPIMVRNLPPERKDNTLLWLVLLYAFSRRRRR